MSPQRESEQTPLPGDEIKQENSELAPTLRETNSQTQHDISSFIKEPLSTRKRVVLEIELTTGLEEQLASANSSGSATTASTPAIPAEPQNVAATDSMPVGIHLIQNTLLRMLDTQFHQLRQTLKNTGKIHEFRQRLQRLSPREFDVLMLILQGRSRKEIASILGVGFATAAKHQTRIFTKLNVRTSVELIHILSAMCVESCALEFNTPP